MPFGSWCSYLNGLVIIFALGILISVACLSWLKIMAGSPCTFVSHIHILCLCLRSPPVRPSPQTVFRVCYFAYILKQNIANITEKIFWNAQPICLSEEMKVEIEVYVIPENCVTCSRIRYYWNNVLSYMPIRFCFDGCNEMSCFFAVVVSCLWNCLFYICISSLT